MTEAESVYCKVRTGSSNMIYSFVLEGILKNKYTSIIRVTSVAIKVFTHNCATG
jgi:hypothetical protein